MRGFDFSVANDPRRTKVGCDANRKSNRDIVRGRKDILRSGKERGKDILRRRKDILRRRKDILRRHVCRLDDRPGERADGRVHNTVH